MVSHYKIHVGPFARGFHLITDEVFRVIKEWPDQGMMTLFIQHTSAGLSINENADETVRKDFELFFDKLAPENIPGLQHDMEGPDDMPAHIKTALTDSCIHIPIMNGRPALGQWQGIYLCEFRNHARRRDLIISIIE